MTTTDGLSPDEFAANRKAHLTGRLLPKKDVGREATLFWRCEAVTLMAHTGHPFKVNFVMREHLERVEGKQLYGAPRQDDREYRFGYYTGNRKGRWHFGQYALMLPTADLDLLLQKAREEGTLLP